jgi:hypothetical protein
MLPPHNMLLHKLLLLRNRWYNNQSLNNQFTNPQYNNPRLNLPKLLLHNKERVPNPPEECNNKQTEVAEVLHAKEHKVVRNKEDKEVLSK